MHQLSSFHADNLVQRKLGTTVTAVARMRLKTLLDSFRDFKFVYMVYFPNFSYKWVWLQGSRDFEFRTIFLLDWLPSKTRKPCLSAIPIAESRKRRGRFVSFPRPLVGSKFEPSLMKCELPYQFCFTCYQQLDLTSLQNKI